jgi:hypothetical protein
VGIRVDFLEVEDQEVGDFFVSMSLRHRLTNFRWEMITVNGGRTEPTGGGDGVGSVAREREEKREREKRGGRKAARRFKYLSCANRTGATQSCHLLWHDWCSCVAWHMVRQSHHMPISHATTVGVTESRQSAWRDSHQHDATSCHVDTVHEPVP